MTYKVIGNSATR